MALGNNDSECGDYKLEPGGAFLTSLSNTVRDLSGADHLASDFQETFTAGGYFAMRHPTLKDVTILVVNDVLWSIDYQDSCGADDNVTDDAMMAWLERQLEDARAAGRRIWLVHHIPVGIDPYETLHAPTGTSCPAKVAPFLKEPFASGFVMLLREIRGHRSGGLFRPHPSGQLSSGDGCRCCGSNREGHTFNRPIFGNNPGFHTFEYDTHTGNLMDFSTWYLSNLDQASATIPDEWQREYVFTQAYGEQAYSAGAVKRLADALLGTGAAVDRTRDAFRRFYPVSSDDIQAKALPAYACAIGHLTPSSYISCYCNR